MNEYGIKESWTKQLSVGPLCAHRMDGCGRNEELLFQSCSRLYAYDLQRVKPPHDINKADVIGVHFVSCVEPVNHIESLVTIEGTKVCVKREPKKFDVGLESYHK